MKFLADENIPLEVVHGLESRKINIVALSDVKPRVSDEELMQYAKKEKRTIITFDKDFGELVFRNKQKSCGVILMK